MQYHMATEHIGHKLTCEQCGKTFNRIDALKNHVTVVHEGLKHQCDFCDKSYNQRNSLRRHIHESHPELLVRERREDSSKIQFEPTPDDIETIQQLAKSIQCEVCQQTFDRPEALKHHLKTEHVKTYECDLCQATFNHRSSWLRHKKNFHINVPVKVEIDVDEEQHLETSIQVKEELLPLPDSTLIEVKSEPTIQVKEEPIDPEVISSDFHEFQSCHFQTDNVS